MTLDLPDDRGQAEEDRRPEHAEQQHHDDEQRAFLPRFILQVDYIHLLSLSVSAVRTVSSGDRVLSCRHDGAARRGAAPSPLTSGSPSP